MSSRDENVQKWASPTIHASRNLASLLIAPADWGKVGSIVHETTVKEGFDVRTRRSNMDLAARHEFNARLEIDLG
jgi:hypothetical protein